MKLPSTTRFAGPVTALLLTLFAVLVPSSSRAEYHGNRSSHVFHAPSCRYFDCAKCTIVFATVQAALDAGYRPCGSCKPSPPSGAVDPVQDARGRFVGNTQSHVFHRGSCRNSGCRHCSVTFESRREALDAGYRPGGCCRP